MRTYSQHKTKHKTEELIIPIHATTLIWKHSILIGIFSNKIVEKKDTKHQSLWKKKIPILKKKILAAKEF